MVFCKSYLKILFTVNSLCTRVNNGILGNQGYHVQLELNAAEFYRFPSLTTAETYMQISACEGFFLQNTPNDYGSIIHNICGSRKHTKVFRHYNFNRCSLNDCVDNWTTANLTFNIH